MASLVSKGAADKGTANTTGARHEDDNKVTTTPDKTVKEIPGKGRGLVARVDIATGTRILCEKPLLTVQPMAPSEVERAVAAKLKLLPKTEQRQFLSLHNHYPGRYPLSGIGGVYATASLINHSCVPNAHHSWNRGTGRETVHAIRDISAGDEITIAYDRGGPLLGFQCECAGGCLFTSSSSSAAAALLLQASDSRRLRLRRLDDSTGDAGLMARNPGKSLRLCRALLRDLADEFGPGNALLARTCYDAFQVCVAHGDLARAAVFARRMYEARVVCEGEDSPDTQRAAALASDPAGHAIFKAFGSAWQTPRDAVRPPEQDEARFNKWLFQE
ncbi:SET domain-containing protein 5 [Lasiosphaeria ovina]|uniref:SET domain-containing protein 5 n=1 Tax=Lasiosphaeria ovina TaxID=92902 RepID=A0AAE0N8K5_9PEZI|nr:SET domain-containing protein 5 [Lasiosphaeria ovina]